MALTEEQAAQMRADAENAWLVDQLPEDEQPPVDPATISNPNFAKSKVVHTRVTEPVYEALEQLAAQTGAAVSDVIRSAVSRYIRNAGDQDLGHELAQLLHEHHLKLVRDETVTGGPSSA